MKNHLVPNNICNPKIDDDFIATKFNVQSSLLSKNMHMEMETTMRKFHQSAEENLMKSLRAMDENAPVEVLYAFARTYLEIVITQEYDVKTLSYNLVYTPQWKDINEIDTESDDFKLLTEYAMQTVKK